MSHWFHRNPLKATGPQMFEVKMFAHDSEALKIISDLKQSRARMLDLLPDPHHTIDQIETALKLYAALLRGFLLQPGDDYIVHYLGFNPQSVSKQTQSSNQVTREEERVDGCFKALYYKVIRIPDN